MKKDEMSKDVFNAHKYTSNNKPELEQDSVCGCCFCTRIYSPSEIKEWIFWPSDIRGTAICPYCDMDTVIGESSGYQITEEFLEKMHNAWF